MACQEDRQLNFPLGILVACTVVKSCAGLISYLEYFLWKLIKSMLPAPSFALSLSHKLVALALIPFLLQYFLPCTDLTLVLSLGENEWLPWQGCSWGCWWFRIPGLCYQELLRIVEEGRKKSLQLQASISDCRDLFYSSLSAAQPLQEEGGKMDKALAHPNTWKAAGVNGEERKASRAKAGLCLCCVLRINKLFYKHYMSCPFPLKERGGRRRKWQWRWFKGTIRTIIKGGRRSKRRVDICYCFSKLPCISWPVCGGGMCVCMFTPEGQWGEMQINSFISS